VWRPLASADATGPIDVVVAHLRGVLQHYRRLDDVLGSRDLVAPVTAQLRLLTDLASRSTTAGNRSEVYRLAAEVYQLAAWLRLDTNDLEGARQYYRQAFRAALGAGDDALASYMVGWLSFTATCGGEPGGAVTLARAANARGAGGPAALRAWLAAIEGRAHAYSRHADETARALERAEALRPDEQEDDAPWYFFGEAACAGYRGTCMVMLGRAREGQALVQATLSALDGTFTRSRGIYQAMLGTAHADLGDLAQACLHAQQAVALAANTGSARGLRTVRDLRRHPLLAHNAIHPHVMELDEQLLLAS
jgi:hypothetical protein